MVIREAIDLTRNNRIDLESLKSLNQVKREDLYKDRKVSFGVDHMYM